MSDVEITTEYIKLDQFLKFACGAGSGAEAKSLIAEGLIYVNDEVESRRGRKLRPGDRVLFGQDEYRIV